MLIAGAAAIAERDVQQAVGTECDVPAIVIRLGLVDGDQRALARGVQRRTTVVAAELRDA
jgi:hypothetical protein